MAISLLQNLKMREGAPTSLAALGVKSVRALSALNQVEQSYRKYRGPYGPLGQPSAALQATPGGYIQPMSLGAFVQVDHQSMEAIAFGPTYRATVYVAGIKCFGTDDPSGEDEIVIITTVKSVDSPAVVTVLGGDDGYNIREGRSIVLNEKVAEDVRFGPDGLSISVAVWDREFGSSAEIMSKTRTAVDKIGDAVKVAALAKLTGITSLLTGGGGQSAIGDAALAAFWDEGMGWVAEGIGSLMDKLLGDDLVGQYSYQVTQSRLSEIKVGYAATLVSSEAGCKANLGVPPGDPLLENGHGSYKVYFRVKVTETSPLPMD